MLTHVLAVVGLGVLCAAWVGLQRWFARHDRGAPGIEGGCQTCGRRDDCADRPR